jgi:hypothetical protein
MRKKNLTITIGALATAAALAGAVYADTQISSHTYDFEGSQGDAWWFAGHAGVDHGLGLAHGGANNGWANNNTGWNAVNLSVATLPGGSCTVSAWIRVSDNLRNGYFTVHGFEQGLPVLGHLPLQGPVAPDPAEANYHQYSFPFHATAAQELLAIGFWGNGAGDPTSWLQVDDVHVDCKTCIPVTCDDLGVCGKFSDGCGKTLDCECPDGDHCNNHFCVEDLGHGSGVGDDDLTDPDPGPSFPPAIDG